ncbi:MAG TPA: mechanosensitive ion channel family protein, partial [Acidobacteriaceae bacterium]|nr:mechanosensitive ion channel family protein [Acidobacteriaceae bacterium]
MYRAATLIALTLLTRAIYAQLPATPAPSPAAPAKPAEQDPLGRETPRGCVLGFLKAAERGHYSQAAEYLETTSSRAQELARQLQVILNHGLSQNVDTLSRSPEGDLKDGLPTDRDRAGFVETPDGKLDILLDRVERRTGPPIWVFSSDTLWGVPEAFHAINAPGIERFFPRAFREVKFLSIPLWRWFLIAASLILVVFLASLMTRALVPLLRPAVRRMTGQTDDRYLLSLKWPIRLILLAIAIRLLAMVALSLLARTFWANVAEVLTIAGVSWMLMKFSDVVADLRSRQLFRRQTTSQLAVLSLAHRLFKILIIFVAVVLLLHSAGVNVSAMLAGLGIGGVALALAAQKTLEDLFGGIAIITRKAVRVGDFCQVADKLGTIEDVGLGSMRVRTLDRTIVTVPNGKVSQMNLENYTMRDKIWFHHIFGLRYGTSPEQVRSVLAEVTQMLRNDKRVESESARIRLVAFGPSSLSFEIFAYVKVRDYTKFVEIQEDLLLHIMDIIAANGTSIAIPAQTTYFDQDRWSPSLLEQPPQAV